MSGGISTESGMIIDLKVLIFMQEETINHFLKKIFIIVMLLEDDIEARNYIGWPRLFL